MASSTSQRVAACRAALDAWICDQDINFPGYLPCFKLIYNTAMWRHPKVGWTLAPNHAGRINKGKYGWELRFGANIFFVDLAISMYSKRISSFLERVESKDHTEYDKLLTELRFVAPLSIGNFEGQRFSTGYPLQDDKLIFGTQAICNKRAVAYVLAAAKLDANFGQLA